MSKELEIKVGVGMGIIQPQRINITFTNSQKDKIGEFYFEDEQWHFEGDTSESAKVFIKEVKRMFNQ